MAKKRIGAINEEIYNKAKRYAELTGKTAVGVIEDILADFFKNTILTNTYLELNKPFYISDKELGLHDLDGLLINHDITEDEYDRLKRTSTFKASLKLPEINEYNRYHIIKKIPNNLDSFNEKYNKFCYGNNPNRHKGVYLQHKIDLSKLNNIRVSNKFYVMEYVKKDFVKHDEDYVSLYVTPITERRLDLVIDLKTHKDVYDNLIEEHKHFKERLLVPDDSTDETIDSKVAERINVGLYLSSFDVMENLVQYKRRENKKI